MSQYSLLNPNGQKYPIKGETVLGREAGCTYVLQDSEISRRHATVYLIGARMMVRDEGSANGTYVNGQQIARPTALARGDELRLGNTVLIVRAPGPPRPATAASESEPKQAKRSRLPWLLGGCALVVLCLVLALGGGFLLAGEGLLDFLPDSMFTSGAVGEYTLEQALADESIDDRQELQAYLGLPDAFTISQVVVDGVPLRLETWRYYGFGTRVDFVEGEIAWTIDIDPVPEGTLFAAWYDPLDFELGMSPSEVARVATTASPAGMSPEALDLSAGGEDLSGASMLVGDQIMIGLDEQGVVYVETMALFPAQEGG